MTICLSGLASAAKQSLAEAVESNGGQHSAALDRRCTHLVTSTTESDKYRFAVSHGIVCVSPPWVRASISRGACVPEADFSCSASPPPADRPVLAERSRPEQEEAGMHALAAACPAASLADSGWRRLPTGADPDRAGSGGVAALRVIRRGAGKRFSAPHPLLTHVVVGGMLPEADARQVAGLATASPALRVVTLAWLAACGQQERVVPEEAYPFYWGMAGSQVTSKPVAGPTGSGLDPTPSGILTGCHFTLTALNNPEELARARHVIKSNGGRIFHDSTVQHVASKDIAYALCPASLTSLQVKTLCSTCSDFAYVPEQHRVTSYWLECSILAGKALPWNRGAPCYRPLPYPFPLLGIQSVRICISGYDANVRAAIDFSVQLVGGSPSSVAMTRANTHLILPTAKGEKYKHCKAFGVVPVNTDWLVDSINAGLLQPEARYHPAPPPGAGQERSPGQPSPREPAQERQAAAPRPSQQATPALAQLLEGVRGGRRGAPEGVEVGRHDEHEATPHSSAGQEGVAPASFPLLALLNEAAGPPNAAEYPGVAAQPVREPAPQVHRGTQGLDDVVDTIGGILGDLSNSSRGAEMVARRITQAPISQATKATHSGRMLRSRSMPGASHPGSTAHENLASQRIEYGL